MESAATNDDQPGLDQATHLPIARNRPIETSTRTLPYGLALGWFLGTVAVAVVAGVIVGAIIKD